MGRPAIFYAIDTLKNIDAGNSHIYLIALEEHASILEKYRNSGHLQNAEIIFLSEKTAGQAQSVFQAMSNFPADEYLIIWNGDSWLNPKSINIDLFKSHNFANLVFTSKMNGDSWSFFKVDGSNRVVGAVEKKRISENASVGLYAFSSIELFLRSYNSMYLNDSSPVEHFVAPLYQEILKYGDTFNVLINRGDFICFGTPNEYLMAATKLAKFYSEAL